MMESILSSVGNIQQIFVSGQIPYDPYYMLKQYVPQINWDEFEQAAQQYENIKITKAINMDDGGMGG